MATREEIFDSRPHWRAIAKYAVGKPNGGYMKRWTQGSVGMMEPMHIYANEYSFLYMKHGHNNILPYRGNIHNFSKDVTPELRREVTDCSFRTLNPAGCQIAAIQRVVSKAEETPHPFGVSYETGYSPYAYPIPPEYRDDM